LEEIDVEVIARFSFWRSFTPQIDRIESHGEHWLGVAVERSLRGQLGTGDAVDNAHRTAYITRAAMVSFGRHSLDADPIADSLAADLALLMLVE
jgi:hypothetical protein